MKVLVVGSGGREHALAWKIQQSPLVDRVFVAPGNPGTEQVAENVAISSDDLEGLVKFACDESIDLTVVGPEAPLCAGIVVLFRERGRLCFGPDKAAAELEGSKAFARKVCTDHRIPGPQWWAYENLAMARAVLAVLEQERASIVLDAEPLVPRDAHDARTRPLQDADDVQIVLARDEDLVADGERAVHGGARGPGLAAEEDLDPVGPDVPDFGRLQDSRGGEHLYSSCISGSRGGT